MMEYSWLPSSAVHQATISPTVTKCIVKIRQLRIVIQSCDSSSKRILEVLFVSSQWLFKLRALSIFSLLYFSLLKMWDLAPCLAQPNLPSHHHVISDALGNKVQTGAPLWWDAFTQPPLSAGKSILLTVPEVPHTRTEAGSISGKGEMMQTSL